MSFKVYIHDLDVKLEVKVRQVLLMSGARFATHIRFTQDLNAANLWVLREDSAFMHYAKKRAEADKFALWLCDSQHQLFAYHQSEQALSAKAIAQFVDAALLQADENQASKVAVNQADVSQLKLIKYLRYGFQQKRGKLFLQYQQAKFLFDFMQMTATYNAAGHQLLQEQPSKTFALENFEFLGKRDSYPLFEHSCSAFSAVWQIMHKLDEAQLLQPLHPESELRLMAWPSFEQVNHNFDDYRLASLLQKRGLNASQVSVLLKLSDKQIYGFFNTVYITGIASVSESTPITINAQANKGLTLTSLWRKVRSSLGASIQIA